MKDFARRWQTRTSVLRHGDHRQQLVQLSAANMVFHAFDYNDVDACIAGTIKNRFSFTHTRVVTDLQSIKFIVVGFKCVPLGSVGLP